MWFFLGDIALMLELFGFVFGLVLLHKGSKEGGLVRAAGVILLIGSIFLAVCTGMGAYKMRCGKFMEHMSKEAKERTRSNNE